MTAVQTGQAGPAEPLVVPDDAQAPDDEVLHLRSVLVSGLPVELGTDAAPATYTVPAVFSRQVTVGEREAIEHPDTTQRLAELGYPDVTLTVSDRRLLIDHTNLTQLKDGLAAAVAAVLRDIDRVLAEQQEHRDHDALASRTSEAERVARGQQAADEVTFH